MQIEFLKTKAGKRLYSDEELVFLFVETRNNVYFQVLYERYAGNIRKKCLNIIKDFSKAEDLTQDIFLKLISNLDSFRNEARFASWLNKLAYNYCIDEIRYSKQRREIAMNEEIDPEDDIDLYKTFDHEDKEEINLKDSLRYLTTNEQEMLFMRYCHDLSVREIALEFKISESATKMRLLRARERLRERLGGQPLYPTSGFW